jgi:hypothetical protein
MTPDGSAPLVATLRRLMTGPVTVRPGERCELCGAHLSVPHAHVVDAHANRLLCTCSICGDIGGRTADTRYRRVPSRYVRLSATCSAADWETLAIPVDLAFFCFSSQTGRVIGFYPGPTGAIASPLRLDTWPLLSAASEMQAIAPDVEALLVRRTAADVACFIVPIDACYELVGRIRSQWTGWNGGDAVQREIAGFFAALDDTTTGRARARL